ncbi:MAG: hypothetical protein ABGZ23_20490 [Fuerstiella sp.]
MKATIARKMGAGFGVLLCLVATLAIVVLFQPARYQSPIYLRD